MQKTDLVNYFPRDMGIRAKDITKMFVEEKIDGAKKNYPRRPVLQSRANSIDEITPLVPPGNPAHSRSAKGYPRHGASHKGHDTYAFTPSLLHEPSRVHYNCGITCHSCMNFLSSTTVPPEDEPQTDVSGGGQPPEVGFEVACQHLEPLAEACRSPLASDVLDEEPHPIFLCVKYGRYPTPCTRIARPSSMTTAESQMQEP